MAVDITNGTKGPSTFVPYRATKLWNEVVQVFREGLSLGRHRRHMKSYESCFIASEAVSWLHEKLQDNSNFGPQVTRNQTVQLLQKFQKAKLIVDVRGPKHEKAEFTDNGRLYRFTDASPMKTPGMSKLSARTPLAMRTSLMNSDSALAKKSSPLKPSIEMQRGHSIACLTQSETAKLHAPKTEIQEKRNRRVLPKRSQSCRNDRNGDDNLAKMVQVTEEETEEIWKYSMIDSLQSILQLKDIEEVLDPDIVDVKHIIHNITQINKNGLVTNVDKKDQLPHWIISAMRCLAYWPEKVEENLPDYPGFESDVYKVIKDYFLAMDEPLITHQLYEVFLSVMVYADNIGKPSFRQTQHSYNTSSQSIPSTNSTENLLMNMTNQDNMGPDHVLVYYDPDVTIYAGDPTLPSVTRTMSTCRSNSGMFYSQTRMETSFGVNTDEPLTRLYQKESPVKDYGYHSNQESEIYGNHRPINDFVLRKNQRPYSISTTEDVFNHSPLEQYLNSQKCGSMNNVHEMPKYSENGLRGRINSWTSIQSGLHQDEQNLQTLSHHYRSQHPTSNAKRYGDKSRPPRHPNSHPAPPPYFQNPPPYIPPPSYNSIYSRPPPHPLGIQRITTAARQQQNSNINPPQSFSPVEIDPANLDMSQSLPHLPQMNPGNVMAESYRQAIDCAGPTSTPIGRSLFANSHQKLRRSHSSPSVLTPLSRSRVYDVLQLCCLLIAPSQRRKLHLLLRFMNKASNNTKLHIDDNHTMSELVLKTFTRCILRSEEDVDHDEILTRQIVTFMVDGYVEIMQVPEYLKNKVTEKIDDLRKMKIKGAWDNDCDEALCDTEADKECHDVESPFVAYCQQVSVAQYERQKMTASQQALHILLDEIINNTKMNQRDRKRHLKQFQKNHPDIYTIRFSTRGSKSDVQSEKSKMKQQLLTKPLLKLKNLRL